MIHLICNAHLDPVWQWEWEEGAAAALATFRIAADFCAEFDGFVFNHNEAILYQWVEEYDPALFARIQTLVKGGKWHIMGGWFLQPDCNMPSGESLVRQILYARRYFSEKFGVEPTTAINFDTFGHSRGVVQLLAKSGYDSYIFCRPDEQACPLPARDFHWVGYDGSTVIGHRAYGHYLSALGEATKKVHDWLADHPGQGDGLILWGVGNHGGGPSRIDLRNLRSLIDETTDRQIVHSTPEAYFRQLRDAQTQLPRHEGDLNTFGPGIYTSQVRVKQQHRRLENEFYALEKMLSHAALLGQHYPHAEVQQALRDLLFAEFHDILPGSSIEPVEETSLRLMAHALENISRLRMRAFVALASGQPAAREEEIPILAYNPHPYPVTGIFECEFSRAEINWSGWTTATIYAGEQRLPSQIVKAQGNVNVDWRKRMVFYATLQPGQMNRFDCKLEVLPEQPAPHWVAIDGLFTFKTAELEVVINTITGLIDRYRVNGVDFLRPHAFRPLVIADNADPWSFSAQAFSDVIGQFSLLPRDAGSRFSGITGGLIDSVRVIEDGEVCAIVEAVFHYHDSFLCMRYTLPKQGTEMAVDVRVFWNENCKMLKLALPTAFPDATYRGQVVYGVDQLRGDDREVVAQKWVAAVSESADAAFSCINDGLYGSSFSAGEIRLSLLRSPAYAALPIDDRPMIPRDRYLPRIDQGMRQYRFWVNGSPRQQRLAQLESEALAHNEKPYLLSYFPSGEGIQPLPLAQLSDSVVQLTAFKRAEDTEDAYIIRLFEPTGTARSTMLSIPALGLQQTLNLGAFEIKSLRLDVAGKTLCEVNLLER